MKLNLTPLAIGLCLSGMISSPVLAATSESQAVAKLSHQVSRLEQEVSALKSQSGTYPKKTNVLKSKNGKQPASAPTAISATDSSAGDSTETLPKNGFAYLPVDLDVPGQAFVSSGPYIGIPLEYAGTNLIINTPSVNQDVALLKLRKNINTRLQALGMGQETDHSHILLSGIVEGQADYVDPGEGSTTSDIDLTNATLDVYVLGPSHWISSLISMTYDKETGTSSGSFANNSRDLNSRLFIRQAFITIGDFQKTPVYGSIGQMYVPFGTYSTNMVSTPLTLIVGRVKARAILLGYQPQAKDAFYASVFGFRGDTHTGSTSRINNGGINLGYRFAQGVFMGDVGGGVIANIADSVGMQAVANTTNNFNGFGGITTATGVVTGNEQIAHRVPAFDVRAMGQIGDHIDLLAEYIAASKSFAASDMTMNSHDARPQALNAEAAYTFQAFARPTSVAVGYQMTKDALALALPAQRYSLVFNTSVWKDTLQSLEFRHDVNYAASARATGSLMPAVPVNSGKSDNAVTAQFDVYF